MTIGEQRHLQYNSLGRKVITKSEVLNKNNSLCVVPQYDPRID